jgi:hypothetical protein
LKEEEEEEEEEECCEGDVDVGWMQDNPEDDLNNKSFMNYMITSQKALHQALRAYIHICYLHTIIHTRW